MTEKCEVCGTELEFIATDEFNFLECPKCHALYFDD